MNSLTKLRILFEAKSILCSIVMKVILTDIVLLNKNGLGI